VSVVSMCLIIMLAQEFIANTNIIRMCVCDGKIAVKRREHDE